MASRVFVYGTLMSGQPNNRLLAGARLIGRATVWGGWDLYDLGAFPAVRRSMTRLTIVHGELWEVDEPTLERLDRLEGVPIHYQRETVRPQLESGEWPGPAIMYVQHQTGGRRGPGRRIPDGRWSRR